VVPGVELEAVEGVVRTVVKMLVPEVAILLGPPEAAAVMWMLEVPESTVGAYGEL
jgi:hypothetical protein